MAVLIGIFKILGALYLGCEIICNIVGIAYLFNYILSDLPQNNLRKSESDEFFDKIWEDSAKHGPVNLEDYTNQ